MSRASYYEKLICLICTLMIAAYVSCLPAQAEERDVVLFKGPGSGLITPVDYRPTEDQIRPMSIIGKDDRETILNLAEYPFSAVAFMDVVCECGCGWECSGTVAGANDMILTAAHSVVCPEHSSPAETIVFYFGYESYRKNLLRYDGNWMALVGNWFEDHTYSFEEDWAVIRLEESVGESVGCLEPAWDPSLGAEDNSPVSILGYSDGTLYRDYGNLTDLDPGHYAYTMDHDTGASGGPILDSKNRVVGIIIGHIIEDDETERNVGIKLTETFRDAFLQLSGEKQQ